MANYVASQLVAAQAKFKQRFQEPELRRKQNPALVLALKNLDATIPTHTELRTREDRPVNAYVMKKIASTNGNSRVARPAGAKGDSMAVGLTWQTISETFSISMKQGDANVYSTQEMLMNQMYQAQQNIHDRLGTTFLNYLIAHRNQVPLGAPVGATWNAVTQAYEVSADDKEWYFQNVAAIMRQQNYRGQLDVLADPQAYLIAQRLRAQGAQNATNRTFQFDNITAIETTEVISAAYTGGVSLAMAEGIFASLPWIPKQNREGRGSYDDYNGGWGVTDDMLGTTINQLDAATGQAVAVPLKYAVYAFSQAADDQANNGSNQDLVTTFEISLDIAPTLAPLSTANESVVNMFGQLVA